MLNIAGDQLEVTLEHELQKVNTHSMAVKALDWRPKKGSFSLASCSLDCSVRIFQIQI